MNLGMADSIIVATSKAYNAEIITSDKHLKEKENVKFIGNHP
jgi:predicted nucleic acid-binding protein